MAVITCIALTSLAVAIVGANSTQDIALKERIVVGDIQYRLRFMALLVAPESEPGYKTGAGVIISENIILTAAHYTYNKETIHVYVGSAEYKMGMEYVVSGKTNIIVHARFDEFTFEYDISLIRTPSKIDRTMASSIRLPPIFDTYMYDDDTALILGWGQIHTNDYVDDHSNVLHSAIQKTLPYIACEDNYENVFYSQICVLIKDGRAPCRGDSGSPLLWRNSEDDKYVVVGIASNFDKSNCGRKNTVLYTRVSSYIQWIERMKNWFLQN